MNLLCAVALLFSSVAPVARAMGKYEPDTCKVQIFEITSSSGVWDASTTSWNSMSGNGGVIPPQYALYPSFTTDPFSSAFLSTDVTDDVAAWLANPADNQGWAFISLMNDMTPDSWGFVTSMNDKPAEHPKLVVVAANCP